MTIRVNVTVTISGVGTSPKVSESLKQLKTVGWSFDRIAEFESKLRASRTYFLESESEAEAVFDDEWTRLGGKILGRCTQLIVDSSDGDRRVVSGWASPSPAPPTSDQ